MNKEYTELRQEPCTKRWVIISPQRAKRPHSLGEEEKEKLELPEWDASCPFCPGNEGQTPPEIFSLKDDKGWRVRVIPNKYPALQPSEEIIQIEGVDPFVWLLGIGSHEVVVESPLHNRTWGNMGVEQMEAVIRCFLRRYRALRADKRLKYICIFRNHGERAGTSLLHPHSQIIATPIVPENIRAEIEEARRYYDDRLHCAYCDVLRRELEAGERLILETDHFVAFAPFASRMPFEVWVLPKKHSPSFDYIEEEEINDLALVLETIFKAFYEGLGDPHYNFIVHSAPLRDSCEDYYHWHIEILPRLTIQAGFELGTGIYINTTFPEEAAKFLRQHCLK
ncbi:MAG: galactose-1-phosphate uridylyltransferase [bacterium]